MVSFLAATWVIAVVLFFERLLVDTTREILRDTMRQVLRNNRNSSNIVDLFNETAAILFPGEINTPTNLPDAAAALADVAFWDLIIERSITPTNLSYLEEHRPFENHVVQSHPTVSTQ